MGCRQGRSRTSAGVRASDRRDVATVRRTRSTARRTAAASSDRGTHGARVTWYDLNLVTHVTSGGVGLVSMLAPLFAKKGGRLHRRAGWVFTIAMAVVAITGLVIALGWLVAPLQLNPPSRVLDPETAARYASEVRKAGLFFGFLAVFVGSAAWQGVVATRQRRGTIAWGNPIDLGFAWVTLGLAVVLLVVGLWQGSPLLLGFGVLGAVGGSSDLRFYRRREHERGAWLIRHLQAMLGGATAATTAFTVQAVGRMLESSGVAAGWMLVAWGVPVVLGTLANLWWTRRMRRELAPRRARS